MIRIDLITGFLGSGKTTFLHGYARYLMDSGLKIGIIENDFGAVNVDMMLLQDLEGEQCEREMVAGGADLDTYRRRFRTKLISMGMRGFDRVLIEPSGIFDAEEFFDALCEEPLNRWYEIGSVIAIVDALLPPPACRCRLRCTEQVPAVRRRRRVADGRLAECGHAAFWLWQALSPGRGEGRRRACDRGRLVFLYRGGLPEDRKFRLSAGGSCPYLNRKG